FCRPRDSVSRSSSSRRTVHRVWSERRDRGDILCTGHGRRRGRAARPMAAVVGRLVRRCPDVRYRRRTFGAVRASITMKIMDRYMIKTFLVPFGICVVIFSVLVILGRFFDRMEMF